MSKGPGKRITTVAYRLLSKLRAARILSIHLWLLGGIAALILLVPANLVSAEQSEWLTPLHHFQLACGSCHESNVGRGADSIIGKVTGDINQLCSSNGCHDYNPVMNHPVGVRVNPTISGNMPLDTAGRITCLTCHYEPPTSDTSTDTGETGVLSLYKPKGLQFCASCHVKMNGTFQYRSHWQFSTNAHLGLIRQRTPSFSPARHTSGIDAESHTCISCHDNVNVTIPPAGETGQQKKSRWRRMKDHPIGMDYAHVALVKSRKYRYPLTEERIRLFDGRVGCGSCHSLYSNERKFLVQSNYRSALCLQCHDL